jgi:hypothetical protein
MGIVTLFLEALYPLQAYTELSLDGSLVSCQNDYVYNLSLASFCTFVVTLLPIFTIDKAYGFN